MGRSSQRAKLLSGLRQRCPCACRARCTALPGRSFGRRPCASSSCPSPPVAPVPHLALSSPARPLSSPCLLLRFPRCHSCLSSLPSPLPSYCLAALFSRTTLRFLFLPPSPVSSGSGSGSLLLLPYHLPLLGSPCCPRPLPRSRHRRRRLRRCLPRRRPFWRPSPAVAVVAAAAAAVAAVVPPPSPPPPPPLRPPPPPPPPPSPLLPPPSP